MADYNDIKQSIATNLPDNNNREITASKLRSTLNEFVDKVETTETGIEENVSDINTKIAGLGKEGIYDVTANNDGATFASLSALLSDENLSTLIPDDVRCGGMSIRFVQSPDNKYVQYRLMSVTFNTTPANWQGVDDEPTTESDNLVKSGGVKKILDTCVGISYVNLIDINSVSRGKYLSNVGLLLSGGYNLSDYIPVNGNNIVFCQGAAVESLPTICVYSKSKTFIRSVHLTPTEGVFQYEFQENDAFIRINFIGSMSDTVRANYGTVLSDWTIYNPLAGYLGDVETKKESEKENVKILSNNNIINPEECVWGSIYRSDGSIASVSLDYGRTGFIEAKDDIIAGNILVDQWNVSYVVFDADKQFIRSGKTNQYTKQEGDAFVCFNFIRIVAYGNYGTTLLPPTYYSPIDGYIKRDYKQYSRIFSRIAFIGDSLMSGEIWKSMNPAIFQDCYVHSYGQMMCAVNGVQGDNYSHGGETTFGWFGRYVTSQPPTPCDFSNFDKTPHIIANSQYDTYIICLGTNEANAGYAVGDLSTDVDLNDYNNNADTFAGSLCKIVQYLKGHSPNAAIFLCTMPSLLSKMEKGGYNTIVRNAVGLFDNCYLIDFHNTIDNDYIIKSLLQKYVYNGHFTTLGYQIMSDILMQQLGEIAIMNDFSSFGLVRKAIED